MPQISIHDKFQCDLCGESFDTVSELEAHKSEKHHIPSRPTPTENREVQRDIGAAGLPTSPEV
jgi:hypothetical protein